MPLTTFRVEYDIVNLKYLSTFVLKLQHLLSLGGVVLLNGPLGAGKTTLVKVFCKGLGIPEQEVTSPTFDLLHCYASPDMMVYHVDGYRLNDPHEWDVIDLPGVVSTRELIFAEWADALQTIYPERLEIWLKPLVGERRSMTLVGYGEHWSKKLKRFSEEISDGI